MAESLKLADALVYLAAENSQLKKDLDGAEKDVKASASGIGDVFKGMLGAQIVQGIVKGVGNIAKGIVSMVGDAAALKPVQATFNNLAASIGAVPTESLEQLRASTRGLVSDAELMQTANLFMAMGLANTNDEMQNQIETATQLGMAMGHTATESAENWALMNANMSVMRLDSFGISSGKVRERIEELTTGVQALSREEAWNIAVNEQAAVAMARVGEQAGTGAQRWAAAAANLKNSIGSGFIGVFENTLGSAASLAQKFTPLLQSIAAGLGGIANQAVEVLKRIVTVMAEKLGIDFGKLSTDAGTWGQNITIQLAKGIASAIGAVMTALNRLGGAIANMLKPGSPPKLLPNIDQWGADAATVYMDGWGEGDFGVFDKLSGKIGGYLKGLSEDVMPKEDVNPWLASLNAAIADTINQLKETGSTSLNVFDDILGQVEFLPSTFQDYARSLLDAELAQVDLTSAMDALEAATAAVSREQDELNRITDEYSTKLEPLNEEMAALQKQKDAIKQKQRLAKLNETLADGEATAEEKALARLEIEEIQLRNQMESVEEERDAAVDAQQVKIDAALEAQEAAQAEVDAKEAALKLVEDQVAANERLIAAQQNANSMYAEQQGILESLAAAMAGVAPALSEGLASLAGGGEGEGGGIGSSLGAGLTDGIVGGMSGLTEQIMAQFAPLEGNIQTLTDTWSGIFSDSSSSTGEKVGKIAEATWDKIKDIVAAKAAELLGSVLTAAWQNMVDAYNAWTDASDAAIYAWFDEMGLMFTKWWDDLVKEIKKRWEALVTKLKKWFAEFKEELQVWLNSVGTAIANAWNNIITTAERLWNVLLTTISTIMDNIRNYISDVFNNPTNGILAFLGNIDLTAIGESIFGTLWTGLQNVWNRIIEWINRKIAEMWTALQTVANLAGWDIGDAPQIHQDNTAITQQSMMRGMGGLFGGGALSLGTTEGTEITLVLDYRGTGRREELSFRLGETRQFLIDAGSLRSAR